MGEFDSRSRSKRVMQTDRQSDGYLGFPGLVKT